MTKSPENHCLAHTVTLFVKGEAQAFPSGERETETVLGFMTGTLWAWRLSQYLEKHLFPWSTLTVWPACHWGSQKSHYHIPTKTGYHLCHKTLRWFGLGGEAGRCPVHIKCSVYISCYCYFPDTQRKKGRGPSDWDIWKHHGHCIKLVQRIHISIQWNSLFLKNQQETRKWVEELWVPGNWVTIQKGQECCLPTSKIHNHIQSSLVLMPIVPEGWS